MISHAGKIGAWKNKKILRKFPIINYSGSRNSANDSNALFFNHA
jgi:hypothetical protein